jgi:hypothetical protein
MKPIENLQNATRLMSILAVAEKHAITSVQVAELFFNKRGAGTDGSEAWVVGSRSSNRKRSETS